MRCAAGGVYVLFGNQADARVKKLGELLTRARKMGVIPWAWITDETRPERMPWVVRDVDTMRGLHRACPTFDPWQHQPVRVVVWSEKSVGGTLAPVLDRYAVPFLVHPGNTSTTVMHATAESTKHDERELISLRRRPRPEGIADLGRRRAHAPRRLRRHQRPRATVSAAPRRRGALEGFARPVQAGRSRYRLVSEAHRSALRC